MKNLISTALLCLMFSTGAQAASPSQLFAGEKIQVSDRYTTQKVNLKGEIRAIEARTSLEVVYTPYSGKAYAEIYAPDNLIDCINLKSEGEVLQVSFKPHLEINGEFTCKVRVYAPKVTEFHAETAASITMDEPLKTSEGVSLNVQSSGRIEMPQVSCPALSLKAASSGIIQIEKTHSSKELTIDCNSSSVCRLPQIAYPQKLQVNSNAMSQIEIGDKGSRSGNTLQELTVNCNAGAFCSLTQIGNVENLRVNCAASSQVELGGKCLDAVFALNSNSQCDATQLGISRNLNIDCNAGSKLNLSQENSIQELNVNCVASSRIELGGKCRDAVFALNANSQCDAAQLSISRNLHIDCNAGSILNLSQENSIQELNVKCGTSSQVELGGKCLDAVFALNSNSRCDAARLNISRDITANCNAGSRLTLQGGGGKASFNVLLSSTCRVNGLHAAGLIKAECNSNSTLHLQGSCSDAKFSTSSGGRINAKKLKAANITADASLSGVIECHTQGVLSASTRSMGHIYYLDNPKRIDYQGETGISKL